MQNIDFLPAEYHQKHARRQSQPWRIVVLAGFVALTASAAFSQFQHRRHVAADLKAIIPQYEEAVRQKGELTEVQSELQAAENEAELLTYLRHCWPRTQLLAALIDPLPDEVTLERLQITREKPEKQGLAEERPRKQGLAGPQNDQPVAPAVADLKRLRQKFDEMTTVMLISGITTDSLALYRYLGALDNSSLFSKAELESSETADGQDGRTEQFQAKLVVRQGYGKPGGPAAPDSEQADSRPLETPRPQDALAP